MRRALLALALASVAGSARAEYVVTEQLASFLVRHQTGSETPNPSTSFDSTNITTAFYPPLRSVPSVRVDSILKFAGATGSGLQSAILSLGVTGSTSGGASSFGLGFIPSSPSSATTQADFGLLSYGITISTVDQGVYNYVVKFDVTSFLNSNPAAGASNYAFLLVPGAGAVGFASPSDFDPNLRPTLTLTFAEAPPTPEPASAALLGIGLALVAARCRRSR